MLVDEVND